MVESVDTMSDIYELQKIRQHISERYRTDPIAHPKLHLSNVPVEITGVYRNIFQVEDTSSGQPKRYALQYKDVLTHNIEILDL